MWFVKKGTEKCEHHEAEMIKRKGGKLTHAVVFVLAAFLLWYWTCIGMFANLQVGRATHTRLPTAAPTAIKKHINAEQLLLKLTGGPTLNDTARKVSNRREDNYTRRFDFHRCIPKRNIFFLKVHKCASTTISNVIVRYGLKHNLTFALPKREDGHIGWPRKFLPGMILPYAKKPNILTHHIVFNETAVREVMPGDTFYLATVREPYSHLKSTFAYFYPELLGQLNMTAKTLENRLIQFLQEPSKYEKPVRRWFKAPDETKWKYYGELSLTHNFMSREFGYDSSIRVDTAEHMHGFAKRMDLIFDLVLVKEYPLESMVLLRRTLCWDFEDVVTLTLNSGRGRAKTWDDVLRERYKRWSKMDHLLYDRLNASFWAKVREQPLDFYREVELLRIVNENVSEYCRRKADFNEILHIPGTRFNKPFDVTYRACNLLRIGPHDVTQYLILKQYGWKKQLYYQFKYRVKDTIDY